MSSGFIQQPSVLEQSRKKLSAIKLQLASAEDRQGPRLKAQRERLGFPDGAGMAFEDYEGCFRLREDLNRIERIARLAELAEGAVLLSEDDALFLFGL